MTVKGAASPDAVRDLYDDLTELLTQTMGGCIHGGYYGGPNGESTLEEGADKLTDLVAERCGLAAGQRVLDAGSGNGKATCRIASAHRVRIIGVTLSGYQVRVSRELAAEQGMADTVDFQVADVQDMPFPDDSFDAAYAIESLCHVNDRAAAYREIGRVLRPGGTMAATDVVLRRPVERDEHEAVIAANTENFKHGPLISRADYEAAIRAAGLEVVEFTDIGDDVWPSFAAVAGNMRGEARYRDSAEFREMVDALERFATVDELGYVLLVAQKPT